LGIRPLKGILLSGPPGTGKTLLAKAAAHYTGSSYIATSGSEFVEVYAGVGAQRVRSLFAKAREDARRNKKGSAIIFIDEMEVLGGSRGRNAGHLEYDQTLNKLLVEMDGLSPTDPTRILVIGATNRQDLVDQALLRPGRFDRVVQVGLPDKAGRLHILKIHTRNKPLDASVDLESLARETFGFSGAHLESLANEAAILAKRQGKKVISQSHLREAVEKVILGEKLDLKPGEAERMRVAFHEAGHAIVSEVLRPDSVTSVTISPRSGALGYVRHSPQDDRYMQARSELEKDIAVLMAGGAAEAIFTGEMSTGASGDFRQAVGIAKRLVFAGLSDLGVVDPDTMSPDAVSRAVNAIIGAQMNKAGELLSEYRASVERLSRYLMAEETATAEHVREALGMPGPKSQAFTEGFGSDRVEIIGRERRRTGSRRSGRRRAPFREANAQGAG